jgi:N-acetylmuramoyl-L-alanine amidase
MKVTKLVVHHSDSDKSKTTKSDIEKWHRQRGFSQIGYHKVIEGTGLINNGRPESIIGAHAKGANHNSLGVCVVGNFEKETPNPMQINSLVKVLTKWCKENKIDQTKIYGHFEVPGCMTVTQCPGKMMKLQMNSIKNKIKHNLNKY